MHIYQTVWARSQEGPESLGFNIICASMRETLTLMLANNKGADQPVHLRSLISAFVIRHLNSKVSRSDIFCGGFQHGKASG